MFVLIFAAWLHCSGADAPAGFDRQVPRKLATLSNAFTAQSLDLKGPQNTCDLLARKTEDQLRQVGKLWPGAHMWPNVYIYWPTELEEVVYANFI